MSEEFFAIVSSSDCDTVIELAVFRTVAEADAEGDAVLRISVMRAYAPAVLGTLADTTPFLTHTVAQDVDDVMLDRLALAGVVVRAIGGRDTEYL